MNREAVFGSLSARMWLGEYRVRDAVPRIMDANEKQHQGGKLRQTGIRVRIPKRRPPIQPELRSQRRAKADETSNLRAAWDKPLVAASGGRPLTRKPTRPTQ